MQAERREDWPQGWRLTAPESHVLHYRGGSAPAELLRVAIAELIARRVLRLEAVEPKRRWQRAPRWALVEGPETARGAEPPLDRILDLVRAAPREPLRALREGSTMAVPVEGVLVGDLGRALRKEFRQLDLYREDHVAPLLVERGLLEPTRPRRRSRAAEFDWTEDGRAADAELTRWLDLGREHLAEWVERDPARAAAFTREAGGAILLMRDQYPELERLRQIAGPAVVEGGGFVEFGGGHDGDGMGLHGLDLDFGGALDLGGGLGDFGGGGGGDGGGGGGGQ